MRMKFNLDEKYISYLSYINDVNYNFSSIIKDYLLEYRKSISKNDLTNFINSKNLSLSEAYIAHIFACEGYDFDDDEITSLQQDFDFKNMIQPINEKEYISNPYYKNVKVKDCKYKNVELVNSSYSPLELVVYDEIYFTDKAPSLEVNKLGFFQKPFNYLEVLKDGTTWMSITPYEINTMKKAINEATGNVLVQGLGLGYYPYMVSLKNEVKKVVVIEKDRDVIEIFNKYLKKFFNNKVEVIEGDAYELTEKLLKEEHFDYMFFDIYHDEADGLPLYQKMLKLIQINKFDIKASYWIERSILEIARRCLICAVIETYYKIKNDSSATEEYDRYIDNFKNLLKTETIDTLEDFENLFSDESIQKMLVSM